MIATTTSQSCSLQVNSTSKTSSGATITATATTVDSTKHSARSHQILSRETSFISKPTISTSEEKEESQLPIISTTIATAQVTKSPQTSVPVAITSASIVTVTSKSNAILKFLFLLGSTLKKIENKYEKLKIIRNR